MTRVNDLHLVPEHCNIIQAITINGHGQPAFYRNHTVYQTARRATGHTASVIYEVKLGR